MNIIAETDVQVAEADDTPDHLTIKGIRAALVTVQAHAFLRSVLIFQDASDSLIALNEVTGVPTYQCFFCFNQYVYIFTEYIQ